VPRLSQHPELMLEIFNEVNEKILGISPLQQDTKIEPNTKVAKPIKIWDM